jgi:hypothetical protein
MLNFDRNLYRIKIASMKIGRLPVEYCKWIDPKKEEISVGISKILLAETKYLQY